MGPPLCARGCNFFGSSATKNLCSKCYKDYLKEEEEEEEAAAAAAAFKNYFLALPVPSRNPEFPEADKNSSQVVNSSPLSTLKNRCRCCNKKVGLLGFSCRCGGVFCGIHRYPESHACKFDHKSVGRVVLAQENPVCKADKLEHRA